MVLFQNLKIPTLTLQICVPTKIKLNQNKIQDMRALPIILIVAISSRARSCSDTNI